MRQSGFSLIELLVVVAIIGMLASVAVVSFRDAQQRAQDAQRLSDVREVTKALELYFTNHAHYPVLTATTTLTGADELSDILSAEDAIPRTPKDPRHPNLSYTYRTNDTGTTYTLQFCLATDIAFNYEEGCENYISP